MSPFDAKKLHRKFHENMTAFSLGMVSCRGIHHLDMANWGNGTDATGPTSVEGSGEFPKSGSCDAVLEWRVRYEFANAAAITFVNQGAEIGHGVRFIGESGWVHVVRGQITASDEKILRDPQNKMVTMPISLGPNLAGCCGGVKEPGKRFGGTDDHTRKFVDAILTQTKANCDIETAVRSDTLCQLALIAIKQPGQLIWDPLAEDFVHNAGASTLLKARPFRGEWKLPELE